MKSKLRRKAQASKFQLPKCKGITLSIMGWNHIKKQNSRQDIQRVILCNNHFIEFMNYTVSEAKDSTYSQSRP
jgi:hypothetical protein